MKMPANIRWPRAGRGTFAFHSKRFDMALHCLAENVWRAFGLVALVEWIEQRIRERT